MGIAELVKFAGLFTAFIGQALFNCQKGIFCDDLWIWLGFHEPGDHFIIGFPRVHPELHERFPGLFPDPYGDALHV